MLSSGFMCTPQFTHLYSYFILCKSFATPCIPCTDSHFINRVIYSLYTRRVKEELPVAFSCSFTMLPGKPLENAIIPARIGFTGTVGERLLSIKETCISRLSVNLLNTTFKERSFKVVWILAFIRRWLSVKSFVDWILSLQRWLDSIFLKHQLSVGRGFPSLGTEYGMVACHSLN